MKNSIVDRPPSKALRFGLRLPIFLYHIKLGWLLGDRFLMLTHTGRKSGLPRQVVVEVVKHDKEAKTYYIVSGWGEKADWYRNIRKTPQVTVQVGRRKFQTEAEFIPVEKAIDIVNTYAEEHPIAFNELSGVFLGEKMKKGSDVPERVARKMPMVAFHYQ